MSLRRHSAADWSYWLVIGALASFALIIMVGPVVVVLATSLTENRSLKFPPTGLSFSGIGSCSMKVFHDRFIAPLATA